MKTRSTSCPPVLLLNLKRFFDFGTAFGNSTSEIIRHIDVEHCLPPLDQDGSLIYPEFMKPVRILLLEPDPDLCGSIYTVLQDAGHVVVTMNDLGVLAHLDTFIQVDLIIVDLDADAERVSEVEALMSHPRYCNRILTVLCYCISDQAPRLMHAGAGNILVKPLDLDALDRMIKSIHMVTS
jgi:CheY-like chemotaxis protein